MSSSNVCAYDGCGKAARSGADGYCVKHYKEVTGKPFTYGRKRCTIEGCEKYSQGARTKHMCAAHFRAQYGPAERKPKKRTVNNGSCKGPECNRPAHCKGYCVTHYGQYYTRGRVWVIGSRPGRSALRECLWYGCGERSVRWGYCEKHAVEELGQCWVPWCEEPVRHKRLGLCDAHTRQNNYMSHKYGIGMAERYKLAEQQNWTCAICPVKDERGSLNIDHCHTTGRVRGLVCGNCNRAIGLFKDDPRIIKNAAHYLERDNGSN